MNPEELITKVLTDRPISNTFWKKYKSVFEGGKGGEVDMITNIALMLVYAIEDLDKRISALEAEK